MTYEDRTEISNFNIYYSLINIFFNLYLNYFI